MARPKTGTTRKVFPLSLKAQDPFEMWLYEAFNELPPTYGKQFLVRSARLFCRDAASKQEVMDLIRDFVEDVKPNSLLDLPKVSRSSAPPRRALPQEVADVPAPPVPPRQRDLELTL